jgi:hypothetical protein
VSSACGPSLSRHLPGLSRSIAGMPTPAAGSGGAVAGLVAEVTRLRKTRKRTLAPAKGSNGSARTLNQQQAAQGDRLRAPAAVVRRRSSSNMLTPAAVVRRLSSSNVLASAAAGPSSATAHYLPVSAEDNSAAFYAHAATPRGPVRRRSLRSGAGSQSSLPLPHHSGEHDSQESQDSRAVGASLC